LLRIPSRFARYLWLSYTALIVHASLYPFAQWRDHGGSAFDYLNAAWPRYITAFDVIVNVLGYMPFGLLAVLSLYPRWRGWWALCSAITGGLVLSISLEALQSFLSARIASNLDVLCNGLGVLLGALLGLASAPWLLDRSALQRARRHWVWAGAHADAGLALLALWLFTQLDPSGLLFGTGDLRDLFSTPPSEAYPADLFVRIEASITACNVLALGLAASLLSTSQAPTRGLVLLLVVSGLVVKTTAFAILREAHEVLEWLTPGALFGLACGVPLLLVLVSLPRGVRLALAALALMAATALVNLAPPNPYLVNTLRVWSQGHFLNFNGLTHIVAALWPFLALLWLMLPAQRESSRRITS